MKLYCPITIDLYRVYPLQVMEAQQGNVGRGAIVTLTAGSAVIDPTDETVEVYAKKPDGTVSWLECSVEDAKVKIDFTNQMLMSIGVLQVELRIKNEDDDITTPIFKVKVNKSNVQSAGRSENELPLLDQIKKNAEDAKTAAEAAETAVGNKVTNPAIGAVGQILEIETVDDEGKPLTYKAVDKPETVDKELSQIVHASKYGIVSDGFSDTVIVIGKDAAAGDVIKYVIKENSGDITVIYDNNDTGEFNITTIDHAGEAAGEKTLTAEKYCTYTFPSEMDVYLPFNIPTKTSQLTDDVGFAKQEEVGKLSEEKANRIVETASGETIVITDSAEAKPLGLAIDGKSEQNQYSGKNLLDCSGLVEKTVNGVTFTPVYDKNESLEYIEVNGTNDGNASVLFIKGKSWSDWFPNDLLVGEYIFDSCPSGGSGDTYYSEVVLYKGGNAISSARSIGLSAPFTINNKVDAYVSVIAVKNGYTANKLRFYPMIRLATVTDSTYEPYCGGIPSPNPNYKQEIRNIGVYDEASGKYAVEVKGTGKNLIGNAECMSGYYLDSTGVFNMGNANFIGFEKIPVLPSTQYAVSSNLTIYTVWFLDASGKPISRNSINNTSGTFTTSGDCAYIGTSLRNTSGVADTTAYEWFQLELGSTATAYEPHRESITATVYLDEPLRKGDKAYWNGGSKVRVDRYRDVEVFDGSDDEKWNKNYTNAGKFAMFGTMLKQKSKQNNDELCNQYIRKPILSGSENFGFDTSSSMGELRVRPTDYATLSLADWKARLAEKPIIVEYPLATPITEEIDIDLGELSMFYPTTILSNDCNANMEVTYIADTKAYIDKKFAELATAMV